MNIVFFSNVSNNTARFVEKLDIPAQRIPIFSSEAPLFVAEPYVLISPTYGGGHNGGRGAVPVQVKKFLSVPENRDLCHGVIAAGNMNFGEYFCIAGNALSAKLNVPYLYRFELLGTQDDVLAVQTGLSTLEKEIFTSVY